MAARVAVRTILDLHERAAIVLGVNFTGLRAVSKALVPLVRSHGRIVNVASTVSNKVFKQLSEQNKSRFRAASTEEDVETLMNEFLQAVKAGNTEESGWPDWAYGVSKLAVVALSRIQAADIDKDKTRRDILVNSCCPGFVLTDMTSDLTPDHYGGERVTPVEGADTPVFLALLPPDTQQPNGRFLLRRQVYDFIETDMHIQL